LLRSRSASASFTPQVPDPARLIADGRVRVNGAVVGNPRAQVSRGAAVAIAGPPQPPRGARKLEAAIGAFAVPVAGRVVNLERTNLGVLTTMLVPDVVDIVAADLSYLSLAAAAPQIEAVSIAATADLIALVKPMYELGLAAPPADPDQRAKAVELAVAAFENAGWRTPRQIESPVTGRRGAIEYLLHLRRRSGRDRK